jgi:hypothetical protein
MSNDMIIDMNNFGPLAPSFQALMPALPRDSEFSSGVTGGFAVVSIRGKVWRIKHQGNEIPIMRTPTEQALSIEVVLVKASAAISKIYYEGSYTQGDDSPPDCWSANGVKPAAEASKPQAATCAGCPKNVWGSKITETGKKTKACADSRRMAVVPLGDIDNETYGGPMLLRVPPASLGELASFDAKMRGMGYPLFAIGVRISFDIESEYQKLIYGAIRPLNEVEAQKVLALRDSPLVARILDSDDAALPSTPAPEQVFEQPPAPVQAQAPAPVAQAHPPQPPKPRGRPAAPAAAPQPQPVPNGFGGAAVAQPAPQPAPVQQPQTNGFGGFAGPPQGAQVQAHPTAQQPAQVQAVAAAPDLDSLLGDLLTD